MSEWSRKLDRYLADAGLSKKQLALKLGVSINTLQKWWGNREPSPKYAQRINELLQEDIPTQAEEEGRQEKSVVVSLVRTSCPFCGHAIERFKNCSYCGRYCVWANVSINNPP